jgi:hypothetical protein
MSLSLSKLLSSSNALRVSTFDSLSCSCHARGSTVALLPAPEKLGLRYEPTKEYVPPGAEVEGLSVDVSESDSDSSSDAAASSSL